MNTAYLNDILTHFSIQKYEFFVNFLLQWKIFKKEYICKNMQKKH